MANYTIQAHSAKLNQTVSGTNTKRFPSPAAFDTQDLANAQAEKYAKDLNLEDHGGAWDWVGSATVQS